MHPANPSLFNFVDILAFTIVETLMFIILYFVKLNLGGIIIACFTIYNLLNLMKAYMALYGNINYFNTIQVINTKKKHQEGLVSQLLPQHVRKCPAPSDPHLISSSRTVSVHTALLHWSTDRLRLCRTYALARQLI